jgi:hypothetical protein
VLSTFAVIGIVGCLINTAELLKIKNRLLETGRHFASTLRGRYHSQLILAARLVLKPFSTNVVLFSTNLSGSPDCSQLMWATHILVIEPERFCSQLATATTLPRPKRRIYVLSYRIRRNPGIAGRNRALTINVTGTTIAHAKRNFTPIGACIERKARVVATRIGMCSR